MTIEKKKQEEKKPGIGGGDSIFDVAPEPENKNITLSSGPYLETLPLAGKTVGEIRKRYADRFEIDEKAQAVIMGKDVDENYTTKAGEALGFIRFAGEKGANAIITIDGEMVRTKSAEGEIVTTNLRELLKRTGPGYDTGSMIIPSGVKAVLSKGPVTILVWEKAPAVQKLSWIRSDSPRLYGPGTKYRNVAVSLPYIIVFAVFSRGPDGMPVNVRADECFFRNEPLKSMKDELCFPALLNCSKYNSESESYPLSWICTQHLKVTPQMTSGEAGDRLCAGMEAVRYCLLETGFNLSSENHEGNSWYGETKKHIPQIDTIEKWEKATADNPMFALEMPWIKTNRSVDAIAQRIFKRCGVGQASVKTSNDLARIMANA